MKNEYSYELYHHGVKGQRWGERNYQYDDGSLTPEGRARYAKNYRPNQRAQDEVHYGRKGMERINRHMRDDGYNVSTARSVEAKRINDARRRSTRFGQIGGIGGGVGGAVAGYKLFKTLKNSSFGQSIDALQNPIVGGIVELAMIKGGSSVGSTLGRYGGQSIGMLSAGYSPDKYRYA